MAMQPHHVLAQCRFQPLPHGLGEGDLVRHHSLGRSVAEPARRPRREPQPHRQANCQHHGTRSEQPGAKLAGAVVLALQFRRPPTKIDTQELANRPKVSSRSRRSASAVITRSCARENHSRYCLICIA